MKIRDPKVKYWIYLQIIILISNLGPNNNEGLDFDKNLTVSSRCILRLPSTRPRRFVSL